MLSIFLVNYILLLTFYVIYYNKHISYLLTIIIFIDNELLLFLIKNNVHSTDLTILAISERWALLETFSYFILLCILIVLHFTSHYKNSILSIMVLFYLCFVLYNNAFILNFEFYKKTLTFNTLLNHTIVAFHPPFVLLSILLTKFILLIYSDKENSIKKPFQTIYIYRIQLLIFYLLSISILLGSLWAGNLFGWGGWWSWDPIEIVSLIYWIIFVVLIHIDFNKIKNNINIVFYFIILETYLFFMLRLNLLQSLHVFQSYADLYSINLFADILLLLLFFIFCLLLWLNNTNIISSNYHIVFTLIIISLLLIIIKHNNLFYYWFLLIGLLVLFSYLIVIFYVTTESFSSIILLLLVFFIFFKFGFFLFVYLLFLLCTIRINFTLILLNHFLFFILILFLVYEINNNLSVFLEISSSFYHNNFVYLFQYLSYNDIFINTLNINMNMYSLDVLSNIYKMNLNVFDLAHYNINNKSTAITMHIIVYKWYLYLHHINHISNIYIINLQYIIYIIISISILLYITIYTYNNKYLYRYLN